MAVTLNGSTDNFSDKAVNLSDPATRAVAVTLSDATALTEVPRALYVGTGGNITMRGWGGTVDNVWKNVPAGTILPFRAQFVRSTGTTAADILALY